MEKARAPGRPPPRSRWWRSHAWGTTGSPMRGPTGSPLHAGWLSTPTPGGSAPAWAGRLQTVAAAGGIKEENGDVDSGEGEGEGE